jgi:hypothetical protein
MGEQSGKIATETIIGESVQTEAAEPQEQSVAANSTKSTAGENASQGFVTFDAGRKYLARVVAENGKKLIVHRFDKKSGEWQIKNESREREACIPLTAAEAEASFPGSVAAWDKAAITGAPTSIEKRQPLSLLSTLFTDQPIESKEMDLEKHRAHIKSLSAEQTITATLNGYQFLEHATAVGDLYLDACQKHFDNRGRGSRIISGYNGFEDFVERGLGAHIRTIQRRLQKYHDPEGVALRAEEEKEKRRLAAAEQKQKAQADDALKPVIGEFEKRAARYEKYFNNGEITPANWLDLLQDEKKRCDLPEWVTKLDTVIAHAKTVIAAKTETVEVEPVIDQPEPTTPEEPISAVVTTEDRAAAIAGYVLAEVRRFGDGTEMLGEVISKLMIEHEKALAE